jgi:hypothetical protein
MKRPDNAVNRPDTPLPSSRSQIDVQTQPLEDIHTFANNRNQHEEGSGEFSLLSESNHMHYLLDSFYSSNLYRTIENRVGRAESQNGTAYSVWVDAPGQEQPAFSIYQFYHELVSSIYSEEHKYHQLTFLDSHYYLHVLSSISTETPSYFLHILPFQSF